MSLDWDITRVQDTDSLTENDRLLLDTLIWASIPVGLSEITKDNAYEFWQRISFYEKIAGPGRFTDYGKTPVYCTEGDVKRFIGLKTNVSRKTRAVFYRTMFEYHERWQTPRKRFDEAVFAPFVDETEEEKV